MRRYACLLMALAVMGCSAPRNTPIPKDPSKWGEMKPAIDQLDDADRALLAQYMARTKMGELLGGSPMPEGMTIGKAIDVERSRSSR